MTLNTKKYIEIVNVITKKDLKKYLHFDLKGEKAGPPLLSKFCIYLFIHLFIYLFTYLFIYLFIYLFAYLFIYLFID